MISGMQELLAPLEVDININIQCLDYIQSLSLFTLVKSKSKCWGDSQMQGKSHGGSLSSRHVMKNTPPLFVDSST